MLTFIFALASFIAVVQGACDNGCSGHGECTLQGICQCHDNWGLGLSHLSGDCSERICPFDIAWVDTPNKIGSRHKYAECSNRGICNRGTGECECFPGYEGRGCARTTCPNDCSGHGRCQYIQNMPFGAVAADYTTGQFSAQLAETFNYYEWDKGKTRGCVCDPEYGDVDCSKRMCPYGTDVMDQRDDLDVTGKYQVQKLLFKSDAPWNNQTWESSSVTFALTFKSKLNETYTTQPINLFGGAWDFRQFLLNIRDALIRLPNRVIDRVDVSGHHDSAYNRAYVNVTFTGDSVQGPQNKLTVKAFSCGDGCTPKITGLVDYLAPNSQNITELQLSDYNSFECGRRGKCDYETGVCNCFAGYSGATCGTISCLV